MTAMSVRVPVSASRRRAGHFGAWRALTAVPAMVGSLLLLVVLFGWMGEWEGAVLLGWIGSGASVFTRVGERVAVRVGAGFRRPTKAQVALLAPAWTSALARAGLTARARWTSTCRAAVSQMRSRPVAAVSRSPPAYL